jgi:predicted NBD/HSP70 family sugar kinase
VWRVVAQFWAQRFKTLAVLDSSGPGALRLLHKSNGAELVALSPDHCSLAALVGEEGLRLDGCEDVLLRLMSEGAAATTEPGASDSGEVSSLGSGRVSRRLTSMAAAIAAALEPVLRVVDLPAVACVGRFFGKFGEAFLEELRREVGASCPRPVEILPADGRVVRLSGAWELARNVTERPGASVSMSSDAVRLISAAAWHVSQTVAARRFMVVTVSSGIGSKIFDRCYPNGVLDDVVYAGEIGHLVVDQTPGAPQCDCGGSGHLGAIASGSGIERQARRLAHSDPSFLQSACALRFGATPGNLNNEEHLVPAARLRDAWALGVVRQCTEPLAQVLSVLQTTPEAFFLIVGYSKHEPDYKRRLEQKAVELGIAHRVRIAGYPGPIGDVWSVIDIHAHASFFDSLPNAILEGMSLRKPAVVTAVGGIPDAVVHGRTGFLVPPGDSSSLAAALLQFLRNPELARACGEAAFRRFDREYQAGLIVRRLERCFLDLVSADARPQPFGHWWRSRLARNQN